MKVPKKYSLSDHIALVAMVTVLHIGQQTTGYFSAVKTKEVMIFVMSAMNFHVND